MTVATGAAEADRVRPTGGAPAKGTTKMAAAPARKPGRARFPAWAISWLQVGPLTLVLISMFLLPALVFVVVSFFDYDRTGIYPALLLDSYREVLTSASTVRVYASTFRFALIVWAITLVLGFSIAYFLIFHVRSPTMRAVLFICRNLDLT